MKLFIIIAFLLGSSQTYGFGPKGHRVIAQIAEANLSEEARIAVEEILGGDSLASVSNWADVMRYSQETPFWSYAYSSNWHFVNIPEHQTYEQSKPRENGDIYVALLGFINLLKNNPLINSPIEDGIALYLNDFSLERQKIAQRQLALKFIIHLIADIHQPMHLGYEEDQGGNKITVHWFDRKTNLHSVWDSRLLESQGLSEAQLIGKLQIQIRALNNQEIQTIQQTTPLDWINEGLLLRENIYAVERFNSRFGTSYSQEFTPVLNELLLKAGLRLAATLNQIFKTKH